MYRTTAAVANCPSAEQARLLNAACRAALAAGAILRDRYEQPHDITLKGAINLVTEADLAAEAAIVALLAAATPEVAVMTEETAATHSLERSGRFWVVDPLDGTTNFAHGFPFFAVSIGLLDHGRPQVAAIYLPILDELASKYAGGVRIAKLNVDENPLTASRYEVQSIPTMLLFKDGKLVNRLVGALPKSAIEQHLTAIMKTN